ncbi:hypothetical protein OG2516_02044 [Oceanicola granulosus HTCC2516]|uniref:Uncharacterized protein n=1 Tax=Oceanicola granulosus (strain ATCC BAA-861 / DSM 15982 / KCTC 12143 / HTCC2516) TaxID=314256 RepID=Q2CHW5_OCEGH|nr:hypothetical protein [Oceanicola granulosus]EAR52179.1 hypothetical protein OG2516_02044 [Oceanicola granulosus HTCC2516]
MILSLIGLLLGAAGGAWRARALRGSRADILQWAAVWALIGALIGLFITVFLIRA